MSKMPVLFVGHGSPMNAIEDNRYTRGWREAASSIPKPQAIVSISAHWFTRGTKVMNEERPTTIYDMYGFPDELYQIVYGSPGNPKLAAEAKKLISRPSEFDSSWGIDHGTWSVLVHMYPDRDIPLFQISIDASAPPEEHYKTGRELKSLREKGVLLFGTGNIVHNLRRLDWNAGDTGFGWAESFDAYIRGSIVSGDHESVINYQSRGEAASLAVPTPDHFNPILYILGASDEGEPVTVFNDSRMMGSMSMTSYLLG